MPYQSPANRNKTSGSTSVGSSLGFWFSRNWLWLALIGVTLAAAIIIPTLQRPQNAGFTPAGQLQGDALWSDASTRARQTGKPILIDFTASWCPPCKEMERSVFPLKEVKQLLDEQFIFVKADVSNERSPGVYLGHMYEITAIPTYMVVDAQGKVIDSRKGYIPPDRFMQWLGRAAAAHHATTPSQSPSSAAHPG